MQWEQAAVLETEEELGGTVVEPFDPNPPVTAAFPYSARPRTSQAILPHSRGASATEPPARSVTTLGRQQQPRQHHQQLPELRAALADCQAQLAAEVDRRRAAEQQLAESAIAPEPRQRQQHIEEAAIGAVWISPMPLWTPRLIIAMSILAK